MKRMVTVFLLVFVVSAVVATLVLSRQRREPSIIPDGISVLFFHAQARCPTCLNMEKLIRRVLNDSFRAEINNEIGMVLIPYDVSENREIVKRFHVGTISVILVEKEKGRIIRHRDLSPDVWDHHGNDTVMIGILSTELSEFIRK